MWRTMLLIFTQHFKVGIMIPFYRHRDWVSEAKVLWLITSTSIFTCKAHSTLLLPLWSNTIWTYFFLMQGVRCMSLATKDRLTLQMVVVRDSGLKRRHGWVNYHDPLRISSQENPKLCAHLAPHLTCLNASWEAKVFSDSSSSQFKKPMKQCPFKEWLKASPICLLRWASEAENVDNKES